MKKVVLKIDGMKCGMCETHVNDVVRKNGNVKKVTSSHSKGETIILMESIDGLEDIKKGISQQGYNILNEEISEYEKKSIFSFLKK
jgi:copper chaperone